MTVRSLPVSAEAARRDASGRALAFALLSLLLLGALALSFAFTPEDIESGRVWLSPTCTFKRLTGWECLGCGLTRGFCALSHGRLGEALDYNRLTPIFYLGFWMGGLSSLWALRTAVLDRLRAAAPRPASSEKNA